MTAHPLDGTIWRLVAYRSGDDLVETPSGATVTLQFHLPEVGGRSAINLYHGTVAFGDGGENGDEATGDRGKQRLTFSGFASTMMAGPEPLMALEFRYLELVQAAHTYSLEDGHLLLEDTGGVTTLRFAPDANS